MNNTTRQTDKAEFFNAAHKLLDKAEAEGTAVMLSVDDGGDCRHLSSADPFITSVFMATMIRNIVSVSDGETATVERFEDYIHATGVALDEMEKENSTDNVVEFRA